MFRGDARKGGRPAEPLDYTTVLYHFARYVAVARQKQPGLFAQETEPLTIHRLRDTYATARCVTCEPASRPQATGTPNVQTTLRYAETDMETVRRELIEARRRRGTR